MYHYTQEHLNDRMHHAVETSNLNELKYYLSSPELSSHADINSLSKYNKPVWNYLSQASEPIQEYVIRFEYLPDNDFKNTTINNAFTWVCSNYDLYAAKGILKQHKDILNSESLNSALMRAVEFHVKESINLLLSEDFPNHVWENAQAVFLALIEGNKSNANTIMSYDVIGTHDIDDMKLLQNKKSNTWLENMLVKLEPVLEIKEPLIICKLWNHIAETGNITLLHYFTQDNKYNINLPIDFNDNIMFKMSIRYSQYDFMEEIISNYGCRINYDIEQYIGRDPELRYNNSLIKLQNLQDAIEFKLLLEADLPDNNKAQSRPKI